MNFSIQNSDFSLKFISINPNNLFLITLCDTELYGVWHFMITWGNLFPTIFLPLPFVLVNEACEKWCCRADRASRVSAQYLVGLFFQYMFCSSQITSYLTCDVCFPHILWGTSLFLSLLGIGLFLSFYVVPLTLMVLSSPQNVEGKW